MNKLDANYWNKRYLNAQTGWDLGIVSTPLKEYFLTLADKNIAILIPGCGNAHEAEWLMNNGFNNVTLVDIAPLAVENLTTKFEIEIKHNRIKILLQDFFELKNQYQLIVEQTFFCALPKNRRVDYCNKMNQLLASNGKLVGLLFASEFENEGPPFGGNTDEYKILFKQYFNKFKVELCYNSVAPRMNNELFFIAQQ